MLNWSRWDNICFTFLGKHSKNDQIYTLFHFENDRDVIECTWGYTHPARSMILYASISGFFLYMWEKLHVQYVVTSVFLWNMRWRYGHSQGETKYSHDSWILYHNTSVRDKYMISLWILNCILVAYTSIKAAKSRT